MYMYICICMYIYIYIYIYALRMLLGPGSALLITILAIFYPPSEIDLGLFWADFTDLEGKHLFHRIG